MGYFMHTLETIPDGLGYSQYDGSYLAWLAAFAVITIGYCLLYRKPDEKGKKQGR